MAGGVLKPMNATGFEVRHQTLLHLLLVVVPSTEFYYVSADFNNSFPSRKLFKSFHFLDFFLSKTLPPEFF